MTEQERAHPAWRDEQALWSKLWLLSPTVYAMVNVLGIVPALLWLGVVRPSAMARIPTSDWVVVLATGEERVVRAINAQHAKSLVVYGDRLFIDAATHKPASPVLVHPSNVIAVRPASKAEFSFQSTKASDS